MKNTYHPTMFPAVRRLWLLLPFAAFGSLGSAHAASLVVDVFFTDLGNGTFQYELTVANTGSEDIPLLSINDAPTNESLITSSLTAPAGFVANYDPMGFIDFVGDSTSFSPGSSISGFGFQSAAAPGSAFTDFSAFTNDGEPATVTTNLVPEPSTAVIAVMALGAGMLRRRR